MIVLFHLKNFTTSENTLRKDEKETPKRKSTNGSWKTFAWAFLCIISHTGQPNTGKRLRLQLFKPRKLRNVNFADLYSWWKSGNRRKYNSSLHVTLTKVSDNLEPALTLTHQKESMNKSTHDPNSDPSLLEPSADENNLNKSSMNVKWQRNMNQPFQIPNNVHLTLSTFNEGCMIVKFSNSGTKLACGTMQSLLVYDVINAGKILYHLRGHSGIIYDLCWSKTDRVLVSCSADATVRVWTLDGKSDSHTDILTHPSYVYTAKLFPNDDSTIISGCFDHVLRVWSRRGSVGYQLMEELTVHLGYLTSLCFSIDNSILYSADHQGVLVAWRLNNFKSKQNTSKVKITKNHEKYKINHIYGNKINHIVCHPNGHRILIHTRNSQIRLVSQEFWATTQTLEGILNQKELIKSCFSPCGSFVVSGSEDGSVFVWDSENGNLVSSMLELPFYKGISCVDFHPFDNMISICSHEPGSPVIIMNYDPTKSSANNVPLNVLPVDSSQIKEEENQEVSYPCEMSRTESLLNVSNQSSEQNNQKRVEKCDESSSANKHWKDVGRELLSKLDFILKAAAEDSSQLVQR